MTTLPFVRCDHSTTEGYKTTPHFIRVVLNPDVKIYPREYKGIKFFVSRDVIDSPRTWKATEVRSGSFLDTISYIRHTKKDCIAAAEAMIDREGTERMNELIDYAIEKYSFGDVMTQNEYMEWRVHNVTEVE